MPLLLSLQTLPMFSVYILIALSGVQGVVTSCNTITLTLKYKLVFTFYIVHDQFETTPVFTSTAEPDCVQVYSLLLFPYTNHVIMYYL